MALVAKPGIGGYSQGPSPESEKASRNKRKFRADTPSDQSKSISSSLDDLPPYEFSAENSGVAHHGQDVPCDMCGGSQNHSSGFSGPVFTESSKIGPAEATKEVESGDLKDADWSELTEAQLEELLLSNLDIILKSAIKKIVACGYTEETATKSIMRAGISHGFKDTMSNIVENAIRNLRDCQGKDIPIKNYFEDLQQLRRYLLAELVCVLRALRPSFSAGDAMWYLLICDMNVSQACTMDGETSTSNNTDNVGPSNGISSMPTDNQLGTEIKTSKLDIPDPCTPGAPTPSLPSEVPSVSGLPNFAKPKKSSVPSKLASEKKNNSNTNAVDKPLDVSGSSQVLTSEGKSNSSRKVSLSNSSKKELLPVQKALHLDKGSRAIGYKGGLKPGKISRLAGASFDRKLKSMAQSSVINQKNVSTKTSKAIGIKVAREHGKINSTADQPNTLKDIGQDADDFNAPLTLATCITPPIPEVNKPTIPVAEFDSSLTELSLWAPGTKPCSQAPVGGHIGVSGINYDESVLNKPIGRFSGSEARDSVIIKLAPRVQELQSQLEEWTEWANQKVMQAARRLGKEKAELKSLRQEKEEAEKLKRDKQAMEENTMKKLSEMENALRKASGQVERANSAFRRLEVENAALRQQMEAARNQSADTANDCREASRREKRTLMELQSWEKQKNLFQEELVNEKHKSVQVQKELGRAKDILGQVEAKLEQELKVKEDLKVQASSIRKEIEQAEAIAKSKEEVTKLKAESSLQKYKDDIQKLEREISQLRLNRDSSKIAALRRGIDESYTSKTTDSQNNSPSHKSDKDPLTPKMTSAVENSSGFASVKRNRECVMCLSEEMSVVFLPCAHQVVCAECNELHEKKGMKECPSCRSPIERRIVVRYAVS
ncbi:unnamed protein product [Rhodiola kirilowii]